MESIRGTVEYPIAGDTHRACPFHHSFEPFSINPGVDVRDAYRNAVASQFAAYADIFPEHIEFFFAVIIVTGPGAEDGV
jgi:hypothetical protein